MNGAEALRAAVAGADGMRTAALWSGVLCLVAAVAWWARTRDQAGRRARLLLAGGGCAPPPAGPPWRASGVRVRAVLSRCRARVEARTGMPWGPEVLCAPAGLVLAWPARSPVPALAGLMAVPVVGAWSRARRRRLRAERWEEAIAGLCADIAGELRAGRPAHAALAEAAGRLRGAGSPDGAEAAAGSGAAESMTRLVAAARFGGDVPQALRLAARGPELRGLAGVAACWEAAVDHGAGLADGLDRVAGALRAERDQRADLRAQLAGPRSTAVMLALLPVFGIVLGVVMGADPLRVLLRTPVGLGCLLVGAALEGAGLAWTARIARAAEEG